MSDLVSLIFYIVSFILSFFFYNIYCKHKNKIFLVLSFIVPMFIGGFRYMVGTDYISYLFMYNNNIKVNIAFDFIAKIASHFGGATALFFIYNFLTLFFIFLGLKNLDKDSKPMAYFCYLFTFYTTSFNIVRQSAAIAIIFYSYKFIINKDLKKWMFFVLLASLFHSSALICLPFYFIINAKKKSYKFLIFILTLIISFKYIDIINLLSGFSYFSHYSIYANTIDELANNRMFYIDLLLLIYILFNVKRITNIDKKFDFYIFIFVIGFALEFTGFFNPYVKRIAEYFLISKVVILPQIALSYSYAKKRILHNLIFIIYCIGIFIIITYVLKQANILPYEFVGGIL